MRWTTLCLAAWLGVGHPSEASCQETVLPFEERLDDELLYLHALVGYDFDLWNDFAWERDRVATNGLRLSYGSVTTKELLTNEELRLNQTLGGGWRFLIQYREYAGVHSPLRMQSFWTGFEKHLTSGFSAFFRLNSLLEKESMDGEVGLSWSSEDREEHLRLALQANDFNYELKNDLGGVSEQSPLALRWLMRTGGGRFWVTSEGAWGRGFERSFDDPVKSPELRSFQQTGNWGRLGLYYGPEERWLLELAGYLEHFREAKGYWDGAGEDYRYRSRLSWLRLRYARNPGQGHGFRLGLQFVQQDSDAEGFRAFDYERGEWLPSLFYSHTRGSHAAELGLMGSLYAWELDHLRDPEDEEKDGLAEKVMLGYTYSFMERGSVRISISHVLSYLGFGGGSVQFNLGF